MNEYNININSLQSDESKITAVYAVLKKYAEDGKPSNKQAKNVLAYDQDNITEYSNLWDMATDLSACYDDMIEKARNELKSAHFPWLECLELTNDNYSSIQDEIFNGYIKVYHDGKAWYLVNNYPNDFNHKTVFNY